VTLAPRGILICADAGSNFVWHTAATLYPIHKIRFLAIITIITRNNVNAMNGKAQMSLFDKISELSLCKLQHFIGRPSSL